MDLQKCADDAFATIEQRTGEVYPHSTLREAIDSFDSIINFRGIEWLLVAASGIGMTHLTWSFWMSEARKAVGDK